MKQPCVYIVGAGPGDPTLISVRGQRYLEAADVVVYDHRVHARLLRARAAGRRAHRRRRGGAEAARAGRDLPAARREGARRQDGRAAEVGRPVRVRQRRQGSAVPARAGHPVRGRAGHPRDHRRPGLRGHPGHLSRRRRRAGARPRPRERIRRGAAGRLGPAGGDRRHARLLRGRAADHGGDPGAARARPREGRDRGAHLRRDAPLAADHRGHARRRLPRAPTTARRRCSSSARSSGCASTCAGSTIGRSWGAGSSSRDRASRRPSSSTCWRSAARKRFRRRHPDRAARGRRRARSRRARRPGRTTGSSSRAPTPSTTSWSGCSRPATSAI